MSLKTYLRFTKRNIRRTPFQALAASMVMFLTFFAMLVFLLLASGSQLVLRYYEGKPQVIAFFKDGTTNVDIKAIQDALVKESRVVGTKYVSKEDALKLYHYVYNQPYCHLDVDLIDNIYYKNFNKLEITDSDDVKEEK